MDDALDEKEHPKDALEVLSNASLIDFLQNEEDNDSSIDSIFDELNRLASRNNNKLQIEDDERTIEEILKEAETLINQPLNVGQQHVPISTLSTISTPLEMRNGILDQYEQSTLQTLSQNDVSCTLLRNYAFDTAFAITLMNSIDSLPVSMI